MHNIFTVSFNFDIPAIIFIKFFILISNLHTYVISYYRALMSSVLLLKRVSPPGMKTDFLVSLPKWSELCILLTIIYA